MIPFLKPQKSSASSQNSGGFTLVELSVVMLIFSIVVSALIALYAQYLQARDNEVSKQILKDANSAIATYYTNNGSYPCPSDLSKGLNQDKMGIDFCGTSSYATVSAAIPLNTCINGGGICRVAGSRDADGDGVNDPILIGGVPFASIAKKGGLTGAEGIARDAWGNMLYYAVSQNLTFASNPTLNRIENGLFNDYAYGVITAVDEFNNNTAGINGDAQFLVLSSGKNRIGSFTIFGTRNSACDTTTKEGENCNNDGTFVASLGSYDSNGADRYDDLIHFNKIPTGELWEYILNGSTGASTASIKNNNTGNVGVMTNTPQTKLDVNGTLSTESTLARVFCKPNGAGVQNCLPLSFFTTQYSSPTLINTPSGATNFKNTCTNTYEAITELKNGQVTCTKVSPPAAPPGPKECDSGYYISGIRTDGCIFCSGGVSPKC